MWWLERSRPGLLAACLLGLAAPMLAACTVTPVHAPQTSTQIALRYPEPQSRLEQVFFQTLSARLAPSAADSAPTLAVSLSLTGRQSGRADVRQLRDQQWIVATATYRVTQGETELARGTRSASAVYSTSEQVLADDRAAQDAREDAVRAVAEAVRLALVADLQP